MPRKVFTAGEILTAADVNTNLMDQSVMVFAGTAARGSAIPTPSEGMVTYLEDLDELQVYTTDWEPVVDGDETATANTVAKRTDNGRLFATGTAGVNTNQVLAFAAQGNAAFASSNNLVLTSAVFSATASVGFLTVTMGSGANAATTSTYLLHRRGTQFTVQTIAGNIGGGASVTFNATAVTITNTSGGSRDIIATLVKLI